VAPTTIPDVERVTLQRVDPVSLEPRTAFEPITMGDWMWGSTVSDDGRYLAATVSNDEGGNPELRLVDLRSWLPVTSWPGSGDLIVHIDAFGSVYYVTYQLNPELRFVATDGESSTLIASLEPLTSVWGSGKVTERVFAVWGTKPAAVGSEGTEQTTVVTIDIDLAGAVTEIPLPGVQIGSVEAVSQGPWAPYLYTSPSFTWDPIGSRLLVVHGDEDVVSEIDPVSGAVTEHPFAEAGASARGQRRSSALSPDGRSLYVATRSVELIEDDDDWMVVTTPAGVLTVDMTTWEVASSTPEPISDIWVSPNGGLLGSGYSTEESEAVYVQESTGLYLLDGIDLSVVTHYPAETPEQLWGPVTFSEGGEIAYASTWVNTPRVHAIELSTGSILSTAESTETAEMIGPAGVLASNH
jgi:hypothetical protein